MIKNIIKVFISQPVPAPSKTKAVAKDPLHELCLKVDQFIIDIESPDIDSEYQYNFLKALYKKLASSKKLNPKYKPLFSKLKDVMMKHGKYDNDSTILNAEDLFKDSLLDNGYSKDDYE